MAKFRLIRNLSREEIARIANDPRGRTDELTTVRLLLTLQDLCEIAGDAGGDPIDRIQRFNSEEK
jgi:hypothetical protein